MPCFGNLPYVERVTRTSFAHLTFTFVSLSLVCALYYQVSEKALNKQAIESYPQPNQLKSSDVIRVESLFWFAGYQCILKDISFAIEPGSFTGLIGANGAGKSSLLRCLYRYNEPSDGAIYYKNENIWQIPAVEYAQRIAVVLQETPAHFNLSVYDVVSIGLVPHQSLFSRTNDIDKAKIRNAIRKVGLEDKSNQAFESLSGGEKQRALIAKAIVQSPELLIMDEPTSHLDVKYQIQVMELARNLGVTVVASFHDLNLASALCDNILVLNQGQLVKQGPPEEVITEKMLSDVFGVCAQVTTHPKQQVPHVTYYYGDETQKRANYSALSPNTNSVFNDKNDSYNND